MSEQQLAVVVESMRDAGYSQHGTCWVWESSSSRSRSSSSSSDSSSGESGIRFVLTVEIGTAAEA